MDWILLAGGTDSKAILKLFIGLVWKFMPAPDEIQSITIALRRDKPDANSLRLFMLTK